MIPGYSAYCPYCGAGPADECDRSILHVYDNRPAEDDPAADRAIVPALCFLACMVLIFTAWGVLHG